MQVSALLIQVTHYLIIPIIHQGMHRIEEYNDDSFNRYDQNTSRDLTRDPRSSTPASRDGERRKRQKREHEVAKLSLQFMREKNMFKEISFFLNSDCHI